MDADFQDKNKVLGSKSSRSKARITIGIKRIIMNKKTALLVPLLSFLLMGHCFAMQMAAQLNHQGTHIDEALAKEVIHKLLKEKHRDGVITLSTFSHGQKGAAHYAKQTVSALYAARSST